jgi:hypothetical protein
MSSLFETNLKRRKKFMKVEITRMQQQCRWYSHLEDVRAHQPDRVLWLLEGYERAPLIFPAGHTPPGPYTRIGTIEELLVAMQQALAKDSSLRQSMKRHNGIIIQAHLNEQGTAYRFCPVPESSFLYEDQPIPLL